MSERVKRARVSVEPAVSTRAKLSALWVVLVLLYVYADVLSLFRPGQIEDIAEGRMGPVDATQATWAYYLLFGALEVVVAVAIVRYAWKWQPHG